jgi:hypothetical protein
MGAEAGAALLLSLLALGILLAPLIWPGPGPSESEGVAPSDEGLEDTPRGQALLALKEIEFDRATGKLSDADYEELKARYTARALLLLDAPGSVPIAVVPACAKCQNPLIPDSRFCEFCGAPAPAS